MDASKLDICLVMGLYPKEKIHEIEGDSIYGIQNAANVFQWNIVNGILANEIANVEIINSVYIGSFPKKNKRLIIPSYEFNVQKGIVGKNIGFLNVPIVKEFVRFFSMKSALKKWALNGRKNKIAIAYAATYPMTKALSYLKTVNHDIITCLVVPDLPIFMNLSQSKTGVLHRIKDKIVQAEMIKADSYVLLTEQMKNMIEGSEKKPVSIVEGMSSAIGRETKKYIVQEGHVDEEVKYKQSNVISKWQGKHCLYAGGLHKRYGIEKMVKAFQMAAIDNAILHIYGDGDYAEELKKMDDKSIIYHGITTNEEVVIAEEQATLLINPRPTTEEFTKYSFPSKNMEYMASGTPVLTTNLPGMPQEYQEYVYLFDDETVEGMARKIREVLSFSPESLRRKGLDAQRFVLENKNNVVQAKKILTMLEQCSE